MQRRTGLISTFSVTEKIFSLFCLSSLIRNTWLFVILEKIGKEFKLIQSDRPSDILGKMTCTMTTHLYLSMLSFVNCPGEMLCKYLFITLRL